jgi:hypothetical protein
VQIRLAVGHHDERPRNAGVDLARIRQTVAERRRSDGSSTRADEQHLDLHTPGQTGRHHRHRPSVIPACGSALSGRAPRSRVDVRGHDHRQSEADQRVRSATRPVATVVTSASGAGRRPPPKTRRHRARRATTRS